MILLLEETTAQLTGPHVLVLEASWPEVAPTAGRFQLVLPDPLLDDRPLILLHEEVSAYLEAAELPSYLEAEEVVTDGNRRELAGLELAPYLTAEEIPLYDWIEIFPEDG